MKKNIWFGKVTRPFRIAVMCSLYPAVMSASTTVSGVGSDEETAVLAALKEAVRYELVQIIGNFQYKKSESTIENSIVSTAKRYTLSHKIIESQDAFGVVNVKVRIEPNTNAILQALKENNLIVPSTAKPRIVLMLDERVKGQPSFEKTATSMLEQQLKRAGFVVVEADQLVKNKDVENTDTYNSEQLATLAFRSGADLILKGQVSVGEGQLQTIYGVTQYAVPIQLNVRVVRSDNAEVVVTTSKTVKKNAQDEFSAGQIGLTVGGQTVGDMVAKQLVTLWQNDLSAPKTVELQASGSLASSLESSLKKLPVVLSSQLRFMEKGEALYDVTVRGTMQDLREAVATIPGCQINLVTKNRLGITSSSAPVQVSYNYDEPDISISSFTVAEIFPSLARRYETSPVASVTVDLKQGVTVENLSVSVMIPEIMELPSETKIPSLAAGSKKSVDIPLIMNTEKLLNNREERRLTGKAVVTFYQNGKKVVRELTVPIELHDANAMDWADANTIASFVTYRNSTVDKFARTSAVAVDKTGFNDQFESALAIFTALKKYGISYVKDPTPSGDARVLDKVQFPLETLEKKSGDCDDTSVLFASLLSAIGTDVAFVSYPDHVLIMFDTGVYSKNRYKLGVDEKSVVIHNDRCWIPVETTLLKKDFFEAWRTAATEYHQALVDGQAIQITDLTSAWKNYPAFNYSRTNTALVAPSVTAEITAALKSVDASLKTELGQAISAIEKKSDKSVEDQNHLGILYARNGEYEKAVSQFLSISGGTSRADILNNLACAQILTGDEKKGAETIAKSLSLKSSPEALVNRALAYYLSSTSPEGVDLFVAAMIEAKQKLPANMNLEKMLGIELGEKSSDKAAGEHAVEQKQTVDKRRMQELLRQRVMAQDLSKAREAKEKGVTANVNVMPFGGVRGADPTQVATVVDLLVWME